MKLDVYEVPLAGVIELKPFIEGFDYLPFREYEVRADLSANLVLSEISIILSRGGFCLAAREQNEVVGLISIEKLNWDTEHFGFPIAKISHLLSRGDYQASFEVKKKLISAALKKCYLNLLLHLSARVNKEDLASIHALESSSFLLMDVLVTYFFDFRKQSIGKPLGAFHVRPYKPSEILRLSEIAQICFGDENVATDRFHADPTLPRSKSDLLYVKWLVASAQEPSSEILVVEWDGKPVGFNICKIGKSVNDQLGLRIGVIELTAVHPSMRGKQVATSLLEASLAWFSGKVDLVETGGQASNYAIQRAWVRTGFKVVRSQCTYHWSPTPNIV